MVLTFIDIILTICTGGLWLIVKAFSCMNSSRRKNKEERKYYKRQNRGW